MLWIMSAGVETVEIGTTGIAVTTVALGCWPISGVTTLGVTDADGALVIDGIPPGSYPYVAWHESLGEARGTVEISARDESGLRLYMGPEK